MRRISISEFGAISNATINLDKMMQVYIGEQASGKSTICKTVYYCLKIRDYTLDFLMDKNQFAENHPNEYFSLYMKHLQKQFMGCFGTTRHMRPFVIRYDFNGNTVTIKRNQDGFIRFLYSKDLKDKIAVLIDSACEMHSQRTSEKISSVFNQIEALAIMKKYLLEQLQEMFCDNAEIVYIPAGRSLLATMSEQLDYSISDMDLTMQEFINLIRSTKSKFGSKIPEMRKTYLKTVKGQTDDEALNIAYDIIRKILKADYASESDGEKIYYDDIHWVKLMYGSSGQQEVLWILLLVYAFILEKRKTFLLIEEPEAHLFPVAQKYVVELIALAKNVTNGSVIITTHSPYILTSMNILLYSQKVESAKKGKPIIQRNMRLKCEEFGAFLVDGSKMEENTTDLLDKETAMIDTGYIDSVSTITNDELNRLIDKEMSDDM